MSSPNRIAASLQRNEHAPDQPFGPEKCMPVHLAVIPVIQGAYGYLKTWHSLQSESRTVRTYLKRDKRMRGKRKKKRTRKYKDIQQPGAVVTN